MKKSKKSTVRLIVCNNASLNAKDLHLWMASGIKVDFIVDGFKSIKCLPDECVINAVSYTAFPDNSTVYLWKETLGNLSAAATGDPPPDSLEVPEIDVSKILLVSNQDGKISIKPKEINEDD